MTHIHIDWDGAYSFNQEDFEGVCGSVAVFRLGEEWSNLKDYGQASAIMAAADDWITETFRTIPTLKNTNMHGMTFHIDDDDYENYLERTYGATS